MRFPIAGDKPQVFAGSLAVGVAAAVGLAIAAAANPFVVAAVGLASGAAVAIGMAKDEAARRSVLLSGLAFSFVLSRWSGDIGFIVLEPWLVVLPVCLLVWGGRLALRRDLPRLDGVGMLALLLVLTAWLSGFGALDVATWLKRAGKITLNFGLYLLLVDWLRKKRHLTTFLRAVFLSCIVAAVGIIVQLTMKWVEVGTVDVFGVSGTFSNANEGATYLAAFIMFVVALYAAGVHREIMTKRMLLATLMVIATGVLLTRSRTGVGCAVVVSTLLFFRSSRARPLVIGGVVILVLLALVPFTQVVVDRLLGTVGLSPNEGAMADLQRGNVLRLYLLEMYWTVIKAYPVFGVGAGCYALMGSLNLVMPIPPAVIRAPMERLLVTSAHNGFLSWWVQVGTLGFAAFVGSLFYGVFALLRARRRWMRRPNGDRLWHAVATGSLGGLLVFMLTNLTADFGVSEVRYWIGLAFTSVSLRGLQQARRTCE